MFEDRLLYKEFELSALGLICQLVSKRAVHTMNTNGVMELQTMMADGLVLLSKI